MLKLFGDVPILSESREAKTSAQEGRGCPPLLRTTRPSSAVGEPCTARAAFEQQKPRSGQSR